MATVITGANRGIGLELCRLYKERGDDVIAVCRKPSAELEGLGVRIEAGIDVSDPAQVADLGKRLADVSVDLLINNAGILRGDSLGNLDFDGIERQFAVNSVGPLRVVKALESRLDAGSKIALITSRMGSIADNTSGGSYGYRMSKSALNAAGASLAHDLKSRKIAVAILHPGWVKTEMTGHSGMVEPAESAAGLAARIDELTLEESGGFWHMNGERLPW